MTLQELWAWIAANWGAVSTGLLLAAWLLWAWKEKRLQEQLALALAALVELAKQYGEALPKEKVLEVANWAYDNLFMAGPAWTDWAVGMILGSREKFGELVWEKWNEFVQLRSLAAGVVQ